MTDEKIIQAEYATTKRVLGRKVLQIILEVPLEYERRVYEQIGCPPLPGTGCPVAVARLKPDERA